MEAIRSGLAAVVLIFSLCASCAPANIHLSGSTAGTTGETATGLQAELNGLVAVIPAGGPHNEMALRSSRHWRKVPHLLSTFALRSKVDGYATRTDSNIPDCKVHCPKPCAEL